VTLTPGHGEQVIGYSMSSSFRGAYTPVVTHLPYSRYQCTAATREANSNKVNNPAGLMFWAAQYRGGLPIIASVDLPASVAGSVHPF
jgi:hypothetical protein